MTNPPLHPDRDTQLNAPVPSVLVSCALLLGVMLLSGLLTVSICRQVYGDLGLQAALLGSVVCTIGTLAAFGLVVPFTQTPHAGSAALGGMLFRLGMPMIGLIALPQLFPQLVEHGLLPAMLANYFVGLIVETLLAVRHVAAGQRVLLASKRSSVNENPLPQNVVQRTSVI